MTTIEYGVSYKHHRSGKIGFHLSGESLLKAMADLDAYTLNGHYEVEILHREITDWKPIR